MVIKVREYFGRTGNVKNNDEYKNYISRGEKNTRYEDRILPKQKKKHSKN